ncbi:ABC transporter substrate-binding protein [Spirochaetia bacterium]|nr:ABC transporter substrate-binding protein [Spirochaetia bacterium]
MNSPPRTLVLLLAACIVSILIGCGVKKAAGKTDIRPVLVVSILPQHYFASRIAGDRVRVMTLVGPGQDPHSYEPTPKQMADLAAAKAWVLSGTEFEIGLRPKIEAIFPDLTIVDGAGGVQFRTIEAHDDGDDDPGEAIDRHTWLGHEPAKIMAGHIMEALIVIDADTAKAAASSLEYRQNYLNLIDDMDREFAILRKQLAPLRGTLVFVYHPAFGYFLDEFGIRQEAVETGGKEPTPRILSQLIEKAKQEGAGAIFVQAQFPVHTAQAVADAAGAVLAPLDPLAPDWLANIRSMGEVLYKTIEAGDSGEAAAKEATP